MDVTTERRRLNSSAQPKLAILMPFTKRLASNTTIALMTNKKRPSVRMVTGNVSKMIRGFTKMLRMASITANTMAVQNESICIPLRMCASPYETTAIKRIRMINLIENVYQHLINNYTTTSS